MFESIRAYLGEVDFQIKRAKRKIAKKLKGFKTLLFNILAASLPIISAINPYDLNLSTQNLAFFIMFVSVVNIYLRFKTDTAIGKKK